MRTEDLDLGLIDSIGGLDFAPICDLFWTVMDSELGSWTKHVYHISDHSSHHKWL